MLMNAAVVKTPSLHRHYHLENGAVPIVNELSGNNMNKNQNESRITITTTPSTTRSMRLSGIVSSMEQQQQQQQHGNYKGTTTNGTASKTLTTPRTKPLLSPLLPNNHSHAGVYLIDSGLRTMTTSSGSGSCRTTTTKKSSSSNNKRRINHHHHDEFHDNSDDDNNSSASSDFYSPVSMNVFANKNKSSSFSNNYTDNKENNRNGRNVNVSHKDGSRQQQQPSQSQSHHYHHHDTSWIGARLSPICSFDNEDDFMSPVPLSPPKPQLPTSRRPLQQQQQQQRQHNQRQQEEQQIIDIESNLPVMNNNQNFNNHVTYLHRNNHRRVEQRRNLPQQSSSSYGSSYVDLDQFTTTTKTKSAHDEHAGLRSNHSTSPSTIAKSSSSGGTLLRPLYNIAPLLYRFHPQYNTTTITTQQNASHHRSHRNQQQDDTMTTTIPTERSHLLGATKKQQQQQQQQPSFESHDKSNNREVFRRRNRLPNHNNHHHHHRKNEPIFASSHNHTNDSDDDPTNDEEDSSRCISLFESQKIHHAIPSSNSNSQRSWHNHGATTSNNNNNAAKNTTHPNYSRNVRITIDETAQQQQQQRTTNTTSNRNSTTNRLKNWEYGRDNHHGNNVHNDMDTTTNYMNNINKKVMYVTWGNVVCITSVFYLVCMGLYDWISICQLNYNYSSGLQYRNEIQQQQRDYYYKSSSENSASTVGDDDALELDSAIYYLNNKNTKTNNNVMNYTDRYRLYDRFYNFTNSALNFYQTTGNQGTTTSSVSSSASTFDDAYWESYNYIRNNHTWLYPSGLPPVKTMLLFGAFSPERTRFFLHRIRTNWKTTNNDIMSIFFAINYLWNVVMLFTPSWFMCSSFIEWIIIVISWNQVITNLLLRLSKDTHVKTRDDPSTKNDFIMNKIPSDVSRDKYLSSFCIVNTIAIYFSSIITGQLWMLAFDCHLKLMETASSSSSSSSSSNNNMYSTSTTTYDETSFNATGCVAWGTCGLMCALGSLNHYISTTNNQENSDSDNELHTHPFIEDGFGESTGKQHHVHVQHERKVEQDAILNRRIFFGLAILLLILSLFQQRSSIISRHGGSSVIGVTACAFWGWAIGTMLSALRSINENRPELTATTCCVGTTTHASDLLSPHSSVNGQRRTHHNQLMTTTPFEDWVLWYQQQKRKWFGQAGSSAILLGLLWLLPIVNISLYGSS